MSNLVTVDATDLVHVITMDDGKANALSPALQQAINDALDGAEAANAAVVLAGRPGRFSAGFDLGVLSAGGSDGVRMLRGGFLLAHRLLSFPRPVVIACTGHAIAMGSFLLLSGDTSVAADGPFRIHANEVAIGMTMPYGALALLRNRLAPAAYQRAAVLAEPFTPANAQAAGWVDHLAEPEAVVATALERATALAGLDATAHAGTKRRTRANLLAELAETTDREFPAS